MNTNLHIKNELLGWNHQAHDQLLPHPHIDLSQLYWASCLAPTFRTLPSPPTITSRALWSCANLLFTKLPRMPPEAHHHRLPRGHEVMQRYKPLLGVLLLGRIHEDSSEAQWRSGPLVKYQVRGASTPSVSYNHTHQDKTKTKTMQQHVCVSASVSASFWQDPHWDWVEGWRRGRGENINEEMTFWWRKRWSQKADRDWQLPIAHERPKTDYLTAFQQRGNWRSFSSLHSRTHFTLRNLILFLCNIAPNYADLLELPSICCLATLAYFNTESQWLQWHNSFRQGALETVLHLGNTNNK